MKKRMLFLLVLLGSLSVTSGFAQSEDLLRKRVTVNTTSYDSTKAELRKLKKLISQNNSDANECRQSVEELEKIVDTGVKGHDSLMRRVIEVTKDCLTDDPNNFEDIRTMLEDLNTALYRERNVLSSGWTQEQVDDFSKKFYEQWNRLKATHNKKPKYEEIMVLLRKAQSLQ